MMISLSRKTDYALVALAYLAQRRGDGTGAVSARRIAEHFNLPLALLMNLLKDLSRAGIVASTRGAQGGYELVVSPQRVTLKQVVETIEGPLRLAACCEQVEPGDDVSCRIAEGCLIREPIRRLHAKLETLLAQTTLADLTDGRAACGLDGEGTCTCEVALQVAPQTEGH